MNRITRNVMLVIATPIGVYGSYTIIRSHLQRQEIDAVFAHVADKRSLLGADYPKRSTPENLVLYGIAMEAIDVSRTPRDFQTAFTSWAKSWRVAAEEFEKGGSAAVEHADAGVRAASENLKAVREKYVY
jgi:hypothetical protein